MQIVSNGDNLHETTNPGLFCFFCFWENKKKNIISMSSAELA